ncbi:hypothetical protein [Polaribacter glomeratus]|uniref:Uncharacterized protein n=1 Tax=Polaribacter glomeratus TaxID=102 RepID=A0A2S7WUQ0_9FLAO|nr:hypothetical protein [Polaribacter glomeratus]PQJ81307.1 hypothetical protein BTO16_01370 [Polaribacter glomeratus]TXD64078.1 hypothetical protein ESX12_16610 [Polaribacter glomeratus]
MRLLTTLFIVTFAIGVGYSQENKTLQNSLKDTVSNKVYLKYDSIRNKIVFTNEKGTEFKKNKKAREIIKGKAYNIILNGINTATIKSKAELKPFRIVSNIPEILKPLLVGIANNDIDLKNIDSNVKQYPFIKNDSLTDDSINEEEVLEKLFDSVKNEVTNLEMLKEKTINLYIKTKYNPDNKAAKEVLASLSEPFNNPKNKKEFIKNVSASVYYINAVTNVFKVYLEKKKQPSFKIVFLYSYLQEINSQVDKKEYIKAVNFIYNSTKAKDKISLESFTAKPGGLDVQINLINSFTKDTIKTQTIDFYTKGNWNLDFTTGFFFADKVDQGYYIEKRDTLINNIRKEKSRNGDVSIGALGHISYKFTSCFKGGFNLGASVSPFDAKTRYFFGLSAILGTKSQLAFNAGASFTKINELSKAVKQDAIGHYVSASVTEVPTFARIRSGFYFAITYNIVSKKKYKD